MRFQCPSCKRVSDHPNLSADAVVNCGDCLMERVEVVRLVPINPKGNDDEAKHST